MGQDAGGLDHFQAAVIGSIIHTDDLRMLKMILHYLDNRTQKRFDPVLGIMNINDRGSKILLFILHLSAPHPGHRPYLSFRKEPPQMWDFQNTF